MTYRGLLFRNKYHVPYLLGFRELKSRNLGFTGQQYLGIEQEKSERVHAVYTVWIPLSDFLFLKVFPEPTFREVWTAGVHTGFFMARIKTRKNMKLMAFLNLFAGILLLLTAASLPETSFANACGMQFRKFKIELQFSVSDMDLNNLYLKTPRG